MRWYFLFLFPLAIYGEMASSLQDPSLLEEAQNISHVYSQQVAKLSPPPLSPQYASCLEQASIWFTLDLSQIACLEGKSTLETLTDDSLWNQLQEIGVQGLYLEGLKQGGAVRTGFSIDSQWGSEKDWDRFSTLLQKKGIWGLDRLIGKSTGLSVDFWRALRNEGTYSGLYHLVQIPEKDWPLLPTIPKGKTIANIPWLSLQQLHQKGYVPECFSPYVKQSQWNATTAIAGPDGITRRWIYLRGVQEDPAIDWLNPTFHGLQIASADALNAAYRYGQKIFFLESFSDPFPNDTLSLWIRKLSGFSVQESVSSLREIQQVSSDFLVDTWTSAALLHALIAQDAEALRLMYRLLLDTSFSPTRLVHRLQPFDRFATDWQEFLRSPQKKYLYQEEVRTADVLRKQLLKEDLAQLGLSHRDTLPLSTWPGFCAQALGISEALQNQEPILNAHLLLAFFYAMQPGIFSFSLSDLLGALPEQTGPLHLFGTNEQALYPSLPTQLGNRRSFACQLKQILSLRKENNLQSAELLEIPQPKQGGTFLLLTRLKETDTFQLLAVNFSRAPAQETIERSLFRNTTAIDLVSSKTMDKSYASSLFQFDLPPLSGKVFLFSPKALSE